MTATPAGVTETGVKYHYQWYVGTKKIKKATKPVYTLKGKNSGKLIHVRVTVTKSGYTEESAESTPTVYN